MPDNNLDTKLTGTLILLNVIYIAFNKAIEVDWIEKWNDLNRTKHEINKRNQERSDKELQEKIFYGRIILLVILICSISTIYTIYDSMNNYRIFSDNKVVYTTYDSNDNKTSNYNHHITFHDDSYQSKIIDGLMYTNQYDQFISNYRTELFGFILVFISINLIGIHNCLNFITNLLKP